MRFIIIRPPRSTVLTLDHTRNVFKHLARSIYIGIGICYTPGYQADKLYLYLDMLCRDWASYWIRIFHEPKNKCCHTIKDVRHWINIGCYIKEWKGTKTLVRVPSNVQLQKAPITTSKGNEPVFQISTYEQKLSLIQAICLKYSYSRKYDIIMV